MAGAEAGVGRRGLAGAAAQSGGATAMSNVVSYESLVHAVSGAVVSERVGSRHGRRRTGGRGRLVGGARGRWRRRGRGVWRTSGAAASDRWEALRAARAASSL